MTVVSGGLSGSQSLQIAGTANDNQLLTRTFASQSSSPLYFSFQFRTTTGSGAVTDDDFVQVGLSDAGAEPKDSIGYGSSTGVFFTRAGTSTTNQSQSAAFTAAGTTYLLVGKLSKTGASATYNQVELFLNPGATEPAATLTSTGLAGAGAGSVDRLTVRTARLDTNDIYTLDDLKVGNFYSDVVVPEPASAAMLGLGGLAFLARRRRSQA